MQSDLKAEKLASFNGIDIYGLKTDKFKTNTINVFFHDKLERETVTKNALIPAILRRGCSGFETLMDISKRTEELYGASFDCGIAKKGERQIIQFYLEYLADEYALGSEGVFDKAFDLLFSIITSPVLENGAFRTEYVEQEKENLGNLIESRVNDKGQYAVERCSEEMCSGEAYSIYEYGFIEDIGETNPQNAYEQYKRILGELPVSIYLTGSFDDKKVQKVVDSFYSIKRGKIKDIDIGRVDNNVSEIRYRNEEMNVTQGKLTLGFRTGIPSNNKDYYSLVVYNGVLGGGIHSKLFQNVREKASLAYYAFSRLEKFKGLMFISSGIEQANKDKALKITLNQLEEIKKGNISDYEFNSTIKTTETGIKSLKDSQMYMVDFYLSQAVVGTNDTFTSLIDRIKAVTKEDVKAVAEKVRLDTVYFLEPRNEMTLN